jgi:pimeloyl-ACP methyl ester carboxylesterase
MKHDKTSRRLLFVLGLAIWPGFTAIAAGQQTLGRTVNVPVDHGAPNSRQAALYFELGAPFDKTKPTVFIIADGQQFYVRREAIKDLQQRLFGPAFNVVGIVSRGATPEFVKAVLDPKGQPDWAKAWRIFNSDQWINDIEVVRKLLLGKDGKVLLYGRSGGAYLVHQYLSKFGEHVQRASTQSPVNPFINRDLAIDIDRFWEEIGTQDRELQPTLAKALTDFPAERVRMLITLQRQHFFVSADKLPAARADLIRALARGDKDFYERARKEYQVDDILEMHQSPNAIPQVVRVFELIYPSGAFLRLGGNAVYPLLETQHHFQKALIDLRTAGKIPAQTFDFLPAHRLETELFILAARWDVAVDYRTSIALAYNYKRRRLFIADDNHVFTKLNEKGLVNQMVQSFLKFGLDSKQFESAVAASEPYRWVEK